jgi:hypothetical protein
MISKYAGNIFLSHVLQQNPLKTTWHRLFNPNLDEERSEQQNTASHSNRRQRNAQKKIWRHRLLEPARIFLKKGVNAQPCDFDAGPSRISATSKGLTHHRTDRRPEITRRGGLQPERRGSTKARRSDLERRRRASKRATAAYPSEQRRGAHETLMTRGGHKYYRPPPSGFPARARRVCFDPPAPPIEREGEGRSVTSQPPYLPPCFCFALLCAPARRTMPAPLSHSGDKRAAKRAGR